MALEPSENAEPTIGHNSDAQNEIIRSICIELDAVNAEIALLQEQRTKIKGRIKSELNWKVADFNAMKRLADLGEDARTKMLATIRAGFLALDIGMQSSFLDALDLPLIPHGRTVTPARNGKAQDIPASHEAPRWSPYDGYIAGYNTGIMGLDAEPRPAQVHPSDAGLVACYDRGHADGAKDREDGREFNPDQPPDLPEDLFAAA